MRKNVLRVIVGLFFLVAIPGLVGASKPQVSLWGNAFQKFSKETRLLYRSQMALQWVPQLGRIAKSGHFEQFSSADRKVIAEMNNLYKWVQSRVALVESQLTQEERTFIAGGFENSLIPFGRPVLPELNSAFCTLRQRKKMARVFRFTDANLATVMSHYKKMERLDQKMNQRFYNQQLLKVVIGRPEIPYQALVIQYLKSKNQHLYKQQSESVRAAKKMESAFHEHHRLKTDLILYGVRRSKKFYADLLKVSNGCRLKTKSSSLEISG